MMDYDGITQLYKNVGDDDDFSVEKKRFWKLKKKCEKKRVHNSLTIAKNDVNVSFFSTEKKFWDFYLYWW